jgi:hypothetical protein
MSRPNVTLRKRFARPALIFCVSAIIFACLRSTDILSADGNYRCFEVWSRQSVFFHGNNHILYPVNVLAWTHLLAMFGVATRTPLQFFSAVELMNVLAGAVSLFFFYMLLFEATASPFISTLATCALGLSSAFIGQAVAGNEPMVGLCWALAAMWLSVRGSVADSMWRLLLAGLLFALSMATYQSMVLVVPAALVVAYYVRKEKRIARLAALGLSGLIGTAVLYGSIYWIEGSHTVPAMVTRFLRPEGSAGFFGASIGKLLACPLGLTAGFTGLLHYLSFDGLNGVLRGGMLRLLELGLLPLVFCAVLGLWWYITAAHWRLLEPRERLGLMAAAIAFAFAMLPALVWNPVYDKLLIEPVGCLIFAAAVGLGASRRFGRHIVLPRIATVACIASVLASLPAVLQRHRGGNPELPAAGRFASMVGPKDLVVGDWDSISTLYGSIFVDPLPDPAHRRESAWAENPRFFSFTTAASLGGRKAVRGLEAAVSRTQVGGGQVYFVNILDVPAGPWEPTMGRRFEVPYEDLAFYRNNSRVIEKLPTRGGEVPVRILSGQQSEPYSSFPALLRCPDEEIGLLCR